MSRHLRNLKWWLQDYALFFPSVAIACGVAMGAVLVVVIVRGVS